MGYSPDVFIKRSTKRLVTPLARIAFFAMRADASNCYLFLQRLFFLHFSAVGRNHCNQSSDFDLKERLCSVSTYCYIIEMIII